MLYVKVMVSDQQAIFLKMYFRPVFSLSVSIPLERQLYSPGNLELVTNHFLFSSLFV